MAAEIEKIYDFSSLSAYSLRERVLIRLADLAFYILISLIGKTIRYETEGLERFDEVVAAGRVPIYAFWHEHIFAGTYFFRNRRIVVITSQSLDGEYIARFIQRFGYGSVRGSSTRGGVGALVEMIRLMKRGLPMAFTLDGPRGPRREAKPGAILLAKKTGNPMVPFVVKCERFWTINSWDKLQIPKPFTRASIVVAEPLYVAPDAAETNIEETRNKLKILLEELLSTSGKS
ncbi:MAG TPA: lysophospholipid acyltransferase family protein [Pyrinomonadaceae bacterium]|nr:lysophospholipid acyltransferase family protein [Pyrinomonadaceae bacterium]